MNKHRDLVAWQRCHTFAVAIYKAARQIPKAEQFGLTDQIKRAAVSAPANIAEGCARRGPKEFARFLGIALASLGELDALLLIARDAELVTAAWYDDLMPKHAEASRVTYGLLAAMRRRS